MIIQVLNDDFKNDYTRIFAWFKKTNVCDIISLKFCLQVNDMKKIIVIGCPGSGKSTFSKKLHEITGLKLWHLDMLYWNSDKTTVEKSVFYDRLSQVLDESEWIVDGNYNSTMELRIEKCDTIFFLDYPTDVCIRGIEERKGKVRSDIPFVETQDDEEFLKFIENYNHDSRPQVIRLLEKYSDRNIFVFTDRAQADEFLEKLSAEYKR